MKASLFLILICFASLSSTAQLKGFSLGPYFEAAKPRGDMAEMNKNGLGIGVAADIKLGKRMAATGSVGYLHFGKKAGTADKPGAVINAVPIRAGLKYKLPIIYMKMESGVARFTNESESPLILSPGIGVRLLGLDVQGSYETWLGDYGRTFGVLRIGYHF